MSGRFQGLQNGKVRILLELPLGHRDLRLLVDVGVRPPKRLLNFDPSMPSVEITKEQWDELELVGVPVPYNENRTWPFQGPLEFCVTPTGLRDYHGKYVTRDREGKRLCSFCYRSPHATREEPERTCPPKKPRSRGVRSST